MTAAAPAVGPTRGSNNFYKAFREVGRVIRTVQLLRFLSDPQLRARTTAATNKAESYNNFAAWLRFGNGGVSPTTTPTSRRRSSSSPPC